MAWIFDSIDLVADAASNYYTREAIEQAIDDAADAAGNEGQSSLIDSSRDAWSDYFGSLVGEDSASVDQSYVESMCSHPEAIIEIIGEMCEQVQAALDDMFGEEEG